MEALDTTLSLNMFKRYTLVWNLKISKQKFEKSEDLYFNHLTAVFCDSWNYIPSKSPHAAS